jgi:hypothetical protein
MEWPPQPGKPLPLASACWYEPIKFEEWFLAPHGHGLEWQRVFGVGPKDRERIWQAIASAANSSVIVEVRDHGRDGVACGVRERLKIGTRSAKVTMSWHYEDSNAPPRLITAYPSP